MQLMTEPRATLCSPILFFFLHVCTAWPIGVVGLALASSLVKAGVPVQQTATIIAASALAFTLEFAWAPLVDSSFTRRAWYLGGSVVMCACLAALLVAPWNLAWVPPSPHWRSPPRRAQRWRRWRSRGSWHSK